MGVWRVEGEQLLSKFPGALVSFIVIICGSFILYLHYDTYVKTDGQGIIQSDNTVYL